MKGRAVAPPAIECRMGVSTSTKSCAHNRWRIALTTSLRSVRSCRVRSLAQRSTSRSAVPGLDIGHAVPLVAEIAAGLGQQLPPGHLDRELTAPRAHDFTPGADPVAQIEADELVELRRHRRQCEELHRAGRIAQLAERQLALRPQEHEAPCDGDGLPRLLAVRELRPTFDDLRRAVGAIEAVRDVAHLEPSDTLRSKTMRSPCKVSQGSTCSMVSECGAMSELSPPVATTVDGPSSSMKRRANPSTCAANP